MIQNGMHYSKDCLCEGCKLAGNRRYIGGGGVYNINDEKPMTPLQNKIEEAKKRIEEITEV